MGLYVYTSARGGTEIFCGAYSAFNRFRQIICKAVGGSWPPHWIEEDGDIKGVRENLNREMWYVDDAYSPEQWPGLWALLNHSDCEGKFTPKEARQVANDLKRILPKIEELEISGRVCPARGHLSEGYVNVTKKFMFGCLVAANQRCIVRFG